MRGSTVTALFLASWKRVARVAFAILTFMTASLSLSAQSVSVSPASLVFPRTLIGVTSASKSVTITNSGVGAQPVNIVMSGDFSESDNCAGSIAGGGACTLHVSFTPTVSGAVSGAASIFDSSNNLLAFAGLTGTGGAPVTATPVALAFGSVAIGTTSAAKTFKLTNNAASAVTITGIAWSSDYAVTTGTCLTAPINPKGTCTVSVQAQPTQAVDNGAIIVSDNNAADNTPILVKLTASGTGSSNSPLSLSKSSLTFKAASGGTSASQTVTVTNTSAGSVTMGAISASSDFSQTNTCPAAGNALAAGAKCNVTITFSPQFIASIGGSVAVAYTGNSSPQLVNLTGNSLAALTVAPVKLTFASQPVGSTSPAQSLKLTNNSAAAVPLSSILPSGDFQIQLSGTACSLSGGALAAGKTCTLEILFAPTIAGSIIGSVTITDPANAGPVLVSLGGTGTSVAASATLTPTSAHQGSTQTILIAGIGTDFGPTTAVNFGSDITAGTVTVNSPTSASVPITIDDVAATGSRTVTITTGAVVANATFSVVAGVPNITVINPNNIQPTQSESVTVTGVFTNWVSGTTTANFGPAVAVGGAAAGAFGPVTVNSPTSLTASLATSGAGKGFRAVQIQTGSQTLTVNNGIDVETCAATAPSVISISPPGGTAGVPLNAQVQIQFSVPMNRTTFSLGNTGGNTIYFQDATSNLEVPGTVSLDASGTIATITPSEALTAGRQLNVNLSYVDPIQDACGNNLAAKQYNFTTAFGANLNGPALIGTSPQSGDTKVPTSNASNTSTPIVLQFNDQLDPITAQAGFSLTTGANAVAGTFSYSADDKTVTFTPASPLKSSSTYTVNYSAQITDTTGNALTNTGSYSFTTGTANAPSGPGVMAVDPADGTANVGLNVSPHVTFSEAVNGLTIPSAFGLYYQGGTIIVPATVTVAPSRLSATITPSAALLPDTQYGVSLCGYTDISGNVGSCFSSSFYTGTSMITTGPTVVTINPASSQTSVPLNAMITAVMSATIDPTTVTSSSIAVTKGGTQVSGTVSLAADGVTFTFIPKSALAASTQYSVAVGGFNDVEGNAAVRFNSSFTTGTSSYASGSFALNSTSPGNKATGVPVNSQVVFNFSNLVDAATVNSGTVQVFDINAGNSVVAGSYSVSGSSVTFTPLTPYPGNAPMAMSACSVLDEAGNSVCQIAGTFTTANTVDKTAPTVTISPANGASNIGLNTPVILTFSKSINPSTVAATSVGLFNGDSAVIYSYTISSDNRTVIVNPGGSAWNPGAIITVQLTSAIQDLSGNQLANTTSQFTLSAALPSAAPQVIALRPGNGATNVAANTAITLFTSAPLNASTIPGALNITDNGVVLAGTLQLFSNAQAIEFTPATPFNPGDLVQVFLGSTAQSTDGVALSSFSGQFTIAGSPTNTAAQVQAVNPFPNAANVPLNTILQVAYNQALLASTVNGSNVSLYQYSAGTYLTPAISLTGNGQIIQAQPASNLAANSQYQLCVSSSVTNSDGVPVQSACFKFTAGTAVDKAAPTIVAEAPSSGAGNIGTNAQASITFNKAINPVSATGSTIQLSGGGTTETPSSINFSPDYTRVSIIPQAPLPASTQMTLTVNGVLSQAGVSVATKSTSFTTAAQPDFALPYVASSSVQAYQANVPANSVFSMIFSKPMDIGSFNAANVNVYSTPAFPNGVPATVSWSADQTTVFIVPNSALYLGTPYCLQSSSLTDLDGNVQQGFVACFTTSFAPNTNPPAVINTSPENSLTQVAINAPVQILFNEPVQPTSIAQVTLAAGGLPVAVTPGFSDANQLLTLTPLLPLAANASYTIAISGVLDTAGNQMTGTVTHTFSTGPAFDLASPQVALSGPAPDTMGVGTNVVPRIQFSKRLNPLSVVTSSNEGYNNNGSVELFNFATGQWVPVTVSMSADRVTATLTPAAGLSPNTQYEFFVGCSASYYDVAGNAGSCYNSFFATGAGAVNTQTTVNAISPANSQTGVPVNAQVNALMSDAVDPTTITNNSITVTAKGGGAVAGTTALGNDGVTLTFTSNSALSASTVYNISVGGFNDVQGNAVAAFSSSFTTGSGGYGSGSFTISSTSPAKGAAGVPVTSSVTFTMTNLIDAASVNANTVYVLVTNPTQAISGSYSVGGNSVTFTPSTQYPAGTQMTMTVCNLIDEAGNSDCESGGTFTTANTVDSTPPTVAITPSNGSANLGLNTQAVLTFSKSINPQTITSVSVNMLNGDVPLNPTIGISHDGRTVLLNCGPLPAGATISVFASHLIKDLSGNALADTLSQFTTAAQVLNSSPQVLSMRPGNGATGVPANTAITLFMSAPINVGTLPGALYITQNGALIAGSATVASGGQSIGFTPSSALAPGTLTQVFLQSTAQDIYGNYLQSFVGSFTTAGSPANTAAQAQAVNPFPGAANVPLNTVIQIEYNQALLSSTVNASNVTLYQSSSNSYLSPAVSLTGGGQVIQIQPASNLAAGSQYKACVSSSVTNADGIGVQAGCYSFTAGSSADMTAPAINYIAPPNSATNIGTNAGVSISFSKAINPVSVTGSTIQLSGGGVTEMPSSISFSTDYTRVTIIPQAQLPSNTQMTIAINGVTSQAGVAVASGSTQFNTAAGADFSAPYVVNPSVQSGQTVGTNAAFAMQFNKPMDPGSVNPAGAENVYVYDSTLAVYVPVNITFSADLTAVFLKPAASLTAGHQFQMCSNSMTDLSGYSQQSFCTGFSSGTGTQTTGPSVMAASPPAGFTGAGINSPVQILFSGAIDAASIGGVTLKQGGSVIPATASLFDGDKGVQLLPLAPLNPSTAYTINVTGVLDITGNAQSSFPSQSFTTGTAVDLTVPLVVSVACGAVQPCAGGTNVPDNASIQVVFTEPMDTASFDWNNSFELLDGATGTIVPATITFSANYTTATIQPTSNLSGGTLYFFFVGYVGSIYDMGGNLLSGSLITFTTH